MLTTHLSRLVGPSGRSITTLVPTCDLRTRAPVTPSPSAAPPKRAISVGVSV